MRVRPALALAFCLASCSDYQLDAHEKPEAGSSDDTIDDAGSVDGDTGPGGDADPQDDAVVETAQAPTYVNTSDALYAWDPEG